MIAVTAALATGGIALAAPASADPASYYDALHAQGVISTRGDEDLLASGQQVCKDTLFYLRVGGDWSMFGARRKAAEDLALNNLQAPRETSVRVANAAIDHLCPQYSHTWAAQ